mmetsp:Transcript_21745/g.35869  ORF Transcript_21745/g.35869 Transcript_21745/m.35869 type:complete len:154 (+) Transcript_21745:255-716(+)
MASKKPRLEVSNEDDGSLKSPQGFVTYQNTTTANGGTMYNPIPLTVPPLPPLPPVQQSDICSPPEVPRDLGNSIFLSGLVSAAAAKPTHVVNPYMKKFTAAASSIPVNDQGTANVAPFLSQQKVKASNAAPSIPDDFSPPTQKELFSRKKLIK